VREKERQLTKERVEGTMKKKGGDRAVSIERGEAKMEERVE
jgi:hypothetical protein